MKKNKFIVFYSIFASILFAASLFYLGFNLITEYSHGYERTKRRFEHFAISVQKLSNENFSSKNDYYKKLEQSIGDLNDFSFLHIKENDKTIFIFPSEDAQASFDSNLINNFTDYFYVGEDYYSIVADLYSLRPVSISYYSKIAFICILIVTIVTFVLIIFYSFEEKRSNKTVISFEENESNESDIFDKSLESENAESNESIKINEDSTNTTFEQENENTIIQTFSIENISEKEKIQIEEKNDEKSENSKDSNEIDLKSETTITEKIETVNNSENIETSFYSPTTGLVKQENLIQRLNTEIEKAVSSEFDLSLILFKFPKLQNTDEQFSVLSKFLINKFQFKDLLFEYNDNGIAVIKMNDNLENALDFSDKLLPELKDLLKENNEVYIGITSRSLRMISGERLLLEANEALVHAQQSPEDPIIAFRANVEKYRQFMENK